MDGRDLSNEICKDYNSNKTIVSLANEVPKFIVSYIFLKFFLNLIKLSTESSLQKFIIFTGLFI
jgi:hypothetical protein